MSTSRMYYDASSLADQGTLDVKGKGYGRLQQQCDSGIDSGNFCDTLPMQVEADRATTGYSGGGGSLMTGRPQPPELILGSSLPVDVENGDSGIQMGEEEDDVERDCGSTLPKSSLQIESQVPMEIGSTTISRKVIASRSSTRSPPSIERPAGKRPMPRIPKRTVTGSSTSHQGGVKTVSAPQRSPSPKSVYSHQHPSHSSTTTTSSSSFSSMYPFTNKENYGPFSLPAVRSTSPLTCNNFRSLNPERVPTAGVSIDIYQLREYMSFFLPDTKDGDTGFHLSVIHNQPDLLDKLLFIMSKDKKLKPVIDEQNRLYQTALHLATHLQQIDSMRKLLIAGASINITDHKGNTPLHIAAKFSSTRPLEELVRYIPIQTILEVSKLRNNEGLSCIHVAAKNGNVEILRKLADLGVDIDMQDFNSGKTALHLAVENNSLACVQFLLETCEADVNSLTYSGCSPLHVASGRGDISIVAYLVSMGADPELYTDEGDIALDLAGSEQVNTFLTKAAALKWY